MKMPDRIEQNMIAPCGVNCLACSAYLDSKNPCPGCRAPVELITRQSCRNCVKKKCAVEKGLQWCFECNRFPCSHIKSLSTRYQQNYGVDLVQNEYDAKQDIDAFLLAQRVRFICKSCGGVIDQHYHRCSDCGSDMHQCD